MAINRAGQQLQKRYSLDDALSMTLDNTSLTHALTDDAEVELGLIDTECSAAVTIEGQEIVVTFTSLEVL